MVPSVSTKTRHGNNSSALRDALVLPSPHGDGENPRALKRASERESRRRRAARLCAMREQVRVLGDVALVLPLLADADAVWDDFLDGDAKRVRTLLRRLAPAVQTAQQLAWERRELVRIVTERQLAAEMIRTVIRHSHTDTWADDVRRWKALVRLAFQPKTVEQCACEVEAAVEAMERVAASSHTLTMQRDFLGWAVGRRVTSHGGRLEFELHKRFLSFDMDAFAHVSWRVYTEPAIFRHVLHGNKGHAAMDVLQEVSPTMMIIHFQERYDESPATFHSLFLVAQIATEAGITQIMRSIDAPEVRDAIAGAYDVWTSSELWFQWLILDRTKPHTRTDFCIRLYGHIVADDPMYTRRWEQGAVAAIVRTEEAIHGRPLISLTPS